METRFDFGMVRYSVSQEPPSVSSCFSRFDTLLQARQRNLQPPAALSNGDEAAALPRVVTQHTNNLVFFSRLSEV